MESKSLGAGHRYLHIKQVLQTTLRLAIFLNHWGSSLASDSGVCVGVCVVLGYQ